MAFKALKSTLSRCLALVLVAVIGLVGCGASSSGLTGKYVDDTLFVIENVTQAISLPTDSPEQQQAQAKAKDQINDYVSRYRRNGKYAGLRSFTTMQTALNALAGHYSAFGNRPLPQKLQQRLEKEFKTVSLFVQRGS